MMEKEKANLLFDRLSEMNYELMIIEKLAENLNENEQEIKEKFLDLQVRNFLMLAAVFEVNVSED